MRGIGVLSSWVGHEECDDGELEEDGAGHPVEEVDGGFGGEHEDGEDGTAEGEDLEDAGEELGDFEISIDLRTGFELAVDFVEQLDGFMLEVELFFVVDGIEVGIGGVGSGRGFLGG